MGPAWQTWALGAVLVILLGGMALLLIWAAVYPKARTLGDLLRKRRR